VRSRLLYGIKDFLGIDYRYHYNVRFTGTAYENRFFATLGKLATPAPLTTLQQQYNDQQRNVRRRRQERRRAGESLEGGQHRRQAGRRRPHQRRAPGLERGGRAAPRQPPRPALRR
jgi:hypothetical protein